MSPPLKTKGEELFRRIEGCLYRTSLKQFNYVQVQITDGTPLVSLSTKHGQIIDIPVVIGADFIMVEGYKLDVDNCTLDGRICLWKSET